MTIAYVAADGVLNGSFATSNSRTLNVGSSADRALLAIGYSFSDNSVDFSSITWNTSNNLSLGATDGTVVLGATGRRKYGSLVGATVDSGTHDLVVTNVNGNAKPNLVGAAYSGVASVANHAYLAVAGDLTPDFTITTVSGDTASILVITDGVQAISCTSGGTVRASGVSTYGWAVVDQVAVGTSTTISLSTTGATPSWNGFGASMTPAASGLAAVALRAFPRSILNF